MVAIIIKLTHLQCEFQASLLSKSSGSETWALVGANAAVALNNQGYKEDMRSGTPRIQIS